MSRNTAISFVTNTYWQSVTSSAGRMGIPLSIGDVCKRAFLGRPMITDRLQDQQFSKPVGNEPVPMLELARLVRVVPESDAS
jgi:hypothetical protein